MAQTSTADQDVEKRIDALLVGAIDPHVHSGPSIAPRGIDHLELLREASAAGFKAIVTKDHDYSGVMTAAMIKMRMTGSSNFSRYSFHQGSLWGGVRTFMPCLARLSSTCCALSPVKRVVFSRVSETAMTSR